MTFKECLEMGVDFMDMHDPGVVYLISEFVNLKKCGLPLMDDGIRVQDCTTGEIIGVVTNKTLKDMYGNITKLIGAALPVDETKPIWSYNDLSRECKRALSKAHIDNIHVITDFCNFTEKDLLKIRDLGRKHVNEIKEMLDKYGLDLKEE